MVLWWCLLGLNPACRFSRLFSNRFIRRRRIKEKYRCIDSLRPLSALLPISHMSVLMSEHTATTSKTPWNIYQTIRHCIYRQESIICQRFTTKWVGKSCMSPLKYIWQTSLLKTLGCHCRQNTIGFDLDLSIETLSPHLYSWFVFCK